MKTEHLMHRHGGRITAVRSVEHSTYKGVAEWFFRGDIEWNDGGKSLDREIPPWALCVDSSHDKEAQAEYAILSDKLALYLRRWGKWHDKPKHAADGRLVHWTPKSKTGSLTL